MKAKRSTITKMYNELPYEAQFQVDNILTDDNLTVETIPNAMYLIEDIKWTLYRMECDMGENDEEGEAFKYAYEQRILCLEWLKKYSKYQEDK